MKITRRIDIEKRFYHLIWRNAPEILNELLPQVDKSAKYKQILFNMAENGKDKPDKFDKKIYRRLRSYVSRTSSSYDVEFDLKIRTMAPHWFDIYVKLKNDLLLMCKNGLPRPNLKNRKQMSSYEKKICRNLTQFLTEEHPNFDPTFKASIKKINENWLLEGKLSTSYYNMMAKIPETVIFKPGQIWKGPRHEYLFTCSVHGDFRTSAASAMGSWKKGSSGHRSNIKIAQSKIARASMKRVIHLSTGIIYESATEAERCAGFSKGRIDSACRVKAIVRGNNPKFSGRWAYCGKDGNVIE